MEIINRRRFISQSGLATAGSLLLPGFLNKLQALPLSNRDKNILVIIQLSGGNDALNTFIPFENDLYYNYRSNIGIGKEQVIPITDLQGMHPAMSAMKPLVKEGEFLLFNQVGYPNPNRSHFRSMDIWHAGSTRSSDANTGWLGRYLDAHCATPEAGKLQAVEFGNELSLAMRGEQQQGFAIDNPDRLYRITQTPLVKHLNSVTMQDQDDSLSYIYKSLQSTTQAVENIHQQLGGQVSAGKYPTSPLANSLKQIGSLIGAGAPIQVYYTSFSGFDTHVRQALQQKRLLNVYADAVAAFADHLKKLGIWDRTLVFTFSEFGRRVQENASGGTDHGAGGSSWMMGGSLKKAGIYNAPPSLDVLEDGDVPYSLDFRSLYATLLSNWLQVSSAGILPGNYQALPVI